MMTSIRAAGAAMSFMSGKSTGCDMLYQLSKWALEARTVVAQILHTGRIDILMACVVGLCGGAQVQPRLDHAAVAQRLDNARTEITPPLGATTYGLDRQRLVDQPGGENRSLARSLAQLPGVTLRPDGEVRVRAQ
jgi:hypothetical protein